MGIERIRLNTMPTPRSAGGISFIRVSPDKQVATGDGFKPGDHTQQGRFYHSLTVRQTPRTPRHGYRGYIFDTTFTSPPVLSLHCSWVRSLCLFSPFAANLSLTATFRWYSRLCAIPDQGKPPPPGFMGSEAEDEDTAPETTGADRNGFDAARKNRRFCAPARITSHLCNTDHIKPGWGVGVGRMERGCRIKKLETVKPPLCITKRMGDMKIKTGVGILALSALTTMMISALASPNSKKVNWLSDQRRQGLYNGSGPRSVKI